MEKKSPEIRYRIVRRVLNNNREKNVAQWSLDGGDLWSDILVPLGQHHLMDGSVRSARKLIEVDKEEREANRVLSEEVVEEVE